MPNADHEGRAAMLPDGGRGAAGAPGLPGVTRTSRPTGRPIKHGLRAMRRTLGKLTTKRLDGRSAIARAVRNFKADVRHDLGGDLTRAQETILEAAAQAWVLVASLDDWISRQPSLVTRKRTLLPVVRDRMVIADSLARNLERLGLDRKARDVPNLREYLQQAKAKPASGDGGTDAS